eukprot:TRINITY_DN449_c0_g1_i1.p1 TRINITY_DN449_c0_g1~~TRINITY_DN449_c0_g1_i1.p1  ORF type:complete len:679 (-),score=175.96 TRINITY_DN449_c0_g1_i1:208-2094(-)
MAETEETPEQKLARGEAPIKKEYLIPIDRTAKKRKGEAVVGDEDETSIDDALEEPPSKRLHTDSTSSNNSDAASDQSNNNTNTDDDSNKKKNNNNNKKKQNEDKKKKKQSENRPNVREPMNLCSIASTKGPEACPYGESCKWGHDLDAYMAIKQPDIGPVCVSFELTGSCPNGIRCRYGASHIVNNRNVIVEKDPQHLAAVAEQNIFPKDLQNKLRKRQVKFPKTVAVLKEFKNLSRPAVVGSTAAKDSTIPIYDVSSSSSSEASGMEGKLNRREVKQVDVRGKLYLAPLTTIGNLPFRRICKQFGADITCGEMALATNLLQGQQSEWALLKRHPCEDIFGVQIAGGYSDTLCQVAELLNDTIKVDFVDINSGCPIDLVCNKGAGAALIEKPKRIEEMLYSISRVIDVPLSIKMRIGRDWNSPVAHSLFPKLKGWGASWATLHGRSRNQRYSKQADWSYVKRCVDASPDLPIIGNGDIYSWEEYEKNVESTGVASVMIARGAIIKPWLFQEIKERRHIDISAQERLEMLRNFTNCGLEHWGSDLKGVETTRYFLLNWLSFLHRYVPVGLLEVVPIDMRSRPSAYFGRNDLETLMASPIASDWVKITELLLGPAPPGFTFTPRHQSSNG